jgi:catechol 2,3-dioxygenase-like lactoylglutathione lyase family enzyme
VNTQAGTRVCNHVGQCTADLERAIRFYTEVLGFELDRRLELPDEAVGPVLGVDPPVGFTAAYLYLGDFVLELMTFDRPGNPAWSERAFNEPGLTHLSFSVDDLDAAAASAEALGATILTRLPMAVMLRDPDGQLLELLTMGYRRHVDADRAARRAGTEG